MASRSTKRSAPEAALVLPARPAKKAKRSDDDTSSHQSATVSPIQSSNSSEHGEGDEEVARQRRLHVFAIDAARRVGRDASQRGLTASSILRHHPNFRENASMKAILEAYDKQRYPTNLDDVVYLGKRSFEDAVADGANRIVESVMGQAVGGVSAPMCDYCTAAADDGGFQRPNFSCCKRVRLNPTAVPGDDDHDEFLFSGSCMNCWIMSRPVCSARTKRHGQRRSSVATKASSGSEAEEDDEMSDTIVVDMGQAAGEYDGKSESDLSQFKGQRDGRSLLIKLKVRFIPDKFQPNRPIPLPQILITSATSSSLSSVPDDFDDDDFFDNYNDNDPELSYDGDADDDSSDDTTDSEWGGEIPAGPALELQWPKPPNEGPLTFKRDGWDAKTASRKQSGGKNGKQKKRKQVSVEQWFAKRKGWGVREEWRARLRERARRRKERKDASM